MVDPGAEWDESRLEDRQANLEKRWENAAKAGLPLSEADKVWGQLSLELEFSGKPLAELECIALYGRRWLETRNPHYIDAAVLLCREHGIDQPQTLSKLVADVAAVRLRGLERGGTAKQVRDEGIHAEALRITCCLHLAGLSLQGAASKAARYIDDQRLGKKFKASTLEREYSAKFRRGEPSLEAIMRDGWERMNEANRQEWSRLVRELPDADDDLQGFRR